METNYPPNLKIGAHTYNLIFADHWEGGNDGDVGYADVQKGVIYIKRGIPASLIFSTLIHEVYHALNTTIDHTLLDSLAEQLSQVLWDNEIIKDDLR